MVSLRLLPFQIATFAGAFLLFVVQPLMAKQILPWFGGAPAVWSACMVFFQVALTAGYLYAHASRRLAPRLQAATHVALLVAALLLLPILVSPAWKPLDAGAPAWRVGAMLAATVGMPYVVLAATAPLLQDWWRRVSHREPYRLYALSNVGSLAALGAYPAVLEPGFAVPEQATLWSIGYGIFVLACGLSAWIASRSGEVAASSTAAARPPSAVTAADVVIWVALSACGSGLLLAATNQLCQDVAVVPLLWILPLAVYLLTFVLTFGGIYPRGASRMLLAGGAAASLYVTAFAASVPLPLQVAAFLALLGGACMVCHGELVAARPAAANLTTYYVALSIGGALGGAFVALLAPKLFTSFLELPLLVLMAVMVAIAPPAKFTAVAGRARFAAAVLWGVPPLVLALAAAWMPASARAGASRVEARRDFYGVLRVEDHAGRDGGSWRGLYHGRVLHGLQLTGVEDRRRATAYFAEGSGAAVAFEHHPRRLAGLPIRVAVFGLGAGTLAAWGRAGDDIRFFELNPAIVDIAGRHFTFMRDSAARVSVVTGDARLALEREMTDPARHGTYDLLIMDAFAGDSVPAHLLTREAMTLYLTALAPSGVLVFHVSNRYLDLRPLVHGLAAGVERPSLELQSAGSGSVFDRASEWVFISADPSFLDRAASAGARPPASERRVVWTDQYSSLRSVLR